MGVAAPFKAGLQLAAIAKATKASKRSSFTAPGRRHTTLIARLGRLGHTVEQTTLAVHPLRGQRISNLNHRMLATFATFHSRRSHAESKGTHLFSLSNPRFPSECVESVLDQNQMWERD
jgi:hypothetical protein